MFSILKLALILTILMPLGLLAKVSKSLGQASSLIVEEHFENKDQSSQMIFANEGTIFIFKKDLQIKSITKVDEYQITKLGTVQGGYRYAIFSKNSDYGRLEITVEYDGSKKHFVPRLLKYQPSEVLGYCEIGRIKEQAKQLLKIRASIDAGNLKSSASISSSCKNLTEPSKSRFFNGILNATDPDGSANLKSMSCLRKQNSDYPMFMRYIYANILQSGQDIQLQCEPLAKNKAQFKSGAPSKITISVPLSENTKPEDIAKLFNHEAIHAAQDIIAASGSITSDPHYPIACCLENDLDKCKEEERKKRREFEESLEFFDAVPSIKKYLSEKYNEIDGSALSELEIERKRLQDLINDYAKSRPACFDSNRQLKGSCAADFATKLEAMQTAFKQRCAGTDPKCNDLQLLPVNIAAVPPAEKIVFDKSGFLFGDAKNKPAQLSTYIPESYGRPVRVPDSAARPQQVMQLSMMAEKMKLYDPDMKTPESRRFRENVQKTINQDESMAKAIFRSIIPPAEASGKTSRIASKSSTANNNRASTTINFSELPKDEQISLMTSIAQGTSPYSDFIADSHSTSTRLPSADSNATIEPVERIKFGGNSKSSKAPSKTLDTSSPGTSALPSATSTTANTTSAGYSSAPLGNPQNTQVAALWQDVLNGRRRWSTSLEQNRALRQYLKTNRIEVIRERRPVIGIQKPIKVFSVTNTNTLRPVRLSQGSE